MAGVVGGVSKQPIRSSSLSNLSSSYSKILSPEIKNILDKLGIRISDIANISKQMAGHTTSIKDIQIIQLSNKSLLNALGLENVEFVIALQAQDEIADIKKKLKKIKESTLDKKIIKKLCKALGLSFKEKTLFFDDQTGGILIVQSAMQELEDDAEDEG
jgi:hypothetical protein